MSTTDRDIAAIATAILKSTSDIEQGRTTYLRTLLEAAQEDLEGRKGQEQPLQLAALKRVHERFYAIVLATAEKFVPKHTRDRSTELHRRANFARTALSALRGHVRAGGDLVSLTPEKVTKAALRVREGPRRPPSAERLKSTAERDSKRLMATLIGLADTDKQAAVAEIQLVMGQLADQLVSLGVVATKDAARAAAGGQALRVGKTLFIPTATHVLRAGLKPS